jgi:hypothetical protein
VALGLLAVAALPGAVAGSRYLPRVKLLEGLYVAVPATILLGLLAVWAARRARRASVLSLGRRGGEKAARWGRRLAYLGLYVGTAGAIALGSFAVLRLYS